MRRRGFERSDRASGGVALGLLLALIGALAPAGWAPAAEPAAALQPGVIVESVRCAGDPAQSYTLYLPSAYAAERRWPVLYCLDARGRGRLAVERFRAGAEALGWIVIGSNDSRSDGPHEPNERAMKAMWQDSHQRFAIDPLRAYIAGFSGGARAAWILGHSYRGSIAGVIGCGGGLPVQWALAAELPFAYFGAAGIRDFNYNEMRRLERDLIERRQPARFAYFAGGHEWLPAEVATGALEWLELAAMRSGQHAKDPTWIETVYRAWRQRAEAEEARGRWTEAHELYAALGRDFEGLLPIEELVAKRTALEARADFQRQRELRDQSEQFEKDYVRQAALTLRELLGAAPESVDLKQAGERLRITELQERVLFAGASPAGHAAFRALEALYVQTSFYLVRDLVQRRDLARAALCYRIALAIHPEATSSWVELARVLALANQRQAALDALAAAVRHGYRDRAALESDIAFSPLWKEDRFEKLLEQMPAQ